MGSGTWTTCSYTTYATSLGRSVETDSLGYLKTSCINSQETFTAKTLDSALRPFNIMRECIDSEEHPNTVPVILALDVTGSMGDAATECANNINVVMTKLFEKYKDSNVDIEFLIMAIGDLSYDSYPIQISQFESDIRIAEQMDKVYFEYGGGGNAYESYTAAWYMGARHTKLDCWKRGKKGIIITLGDEQCNPYLPQTALENATGDTLQGDINTSDLLKEVCEKYHIYHIDVDHRKWRDTGITPSWKEYMDEDHFKSVPLNAVTDTLIEMICHAVDTENNEIGVGITPETTGIQTNEAGEICW